MPYLLLQSTLRSQAFREVRLFPGESLGSSLDQSAKSKLLCVGKELPWNLGTNSVKEEGEQRQVWTLRRSVGGSKYTRLDKRRGFSEAWAGLWFLQAILRT